MKTQYLPKKREARAENANSQDHLIIKTKKSDISGNPNIMRQNDSKSVLDQHINSPTVELDSDFQNLDNFKKINSSKKMNRNKSRELEMITIEEK